MPEVIWHLIENPDGTEFLKRANQRLTSQANSPEEALESYVSASQSVLPLSHAVSNLNTFCVIEYISVLLVKEGFGEKLAR